MTSNEILKADLLDILFDNRNKQYGAYALRKTYNNRLGIALAISLSTILLTFLLIGMNNSSTTSMPAIDKGIVVIHDIVVPQVKKSEPVIPKITDPLPQVKTQKLTTFAIKRDDQVKDPVVDLRLLTTSAISNVKLDGIDATNTPVIKEQVTTTVIKEEPRQVAEVAPSREPEFPGGQQAWLNFLQKNLRAPDELQGGEKKMVAIRFFVSTEGVVTNFEVVQSAGAVYDNEVIRVLKKMPKWKPAIQSGRAVARAFTQPVTFMGVEQ